jgi:hypothetical protein
MKIGNVDVKVSIIAIAVFVFFTLFLSLLPEQPRGQIPAYLADPGPVHAPCHPHCAQLHEPQPVRGSRAGL